MNKLRDVGEAVTGLLSSQGTDGAEGKTSTPIRIYRDWTARPRDTILSALRYTKFVAFMKGALPLAAAAVVAAVGAYFFFQGAPDRVSLSYESTGRIDNDLAMIKPRLTGLDDSGNPFVITADAAIQDSKNARRARLENVSADIQAGRDQWLNATAVRGIYDMDANSLTLSDGLSVYSDQGYELHTQSASVDLKAGLMAGPEVTGQSPMGSFRASKFRIDRGKEQLVLTGNVHMTLNQEN